MTDPTALRSLLEAATQGEWRGVPADDYQIVATAYPTSYPHRFRSDDTGSALAVFGNRPADFGKANRDLVVAAVNALPALLDELVALKAERDEARADSVHQAKLLTRYRGTLLRINDRIEDEGDRVFFGSTNDADDFREIVKKVDAFGWDQIMPSTKGRDVWAEMRELRQRAEASEARNAALVEALTRAADEFRLIEMRLRDDQPERALGATICGQKDARSVLDGGKG